MPAEEQVKAVAKKLVELNPGFDGKEKHEIEGGTVTKLYFVADDVADISSVRGLKGLGLLACSASGPGASRFDAVSFEGRVSCASILQSHACIQLIAARRNASDDP